MQTPRDDSIGDDELLIRVLYAFVQSAAELSALFSVDLKTFERLGHMAAFHVLRRQNLDLNEIAAKLGVSRRKVDQLSRLLKDNFFARCVEPDAGEALQRRIEFMLWAQPMSGQRIKQVLKAVEQQDVEDALRELETASRVAVSEGTYRITTPERRLVRDDWLARVGGLNHQLEAVRSTALGRFVEDREDAFTRTVSMRVRRDRIQELEALYREQIWPLLLKLDAECADAPPDEVEPILFSLCWAPAQQPELRLTRTTKRTKDEETKR